MSRPCVRQLGSILRATPTCRGSETVATTIRATTRSNTLFWKSKRHVSSLPRGISDAHPTVPFCPEPSCECAPTPELDIDRSAQLGNTAPFYHQHVVISTGRFDWLSRIEDENEPADMTRRGPGDQSNQAEQVTGQRQTQRQVALAAGLKKGIGAGGSWFSPNRNVSVSNSSFPPPEQDKGSEPRATAMLFPSFQVVENIHDTAPGHEDFIRNFVHGDASSEKSSYFNVTPIEKPVVLICSHGSRDMRCGIMGPLLHSEILRQLPMLKLDELASNIGMCSHIGGHKWAGNLIIYIPPKWSSQSPDGTRSESLLAGKGIWYGRVEPKHVEGIMHETIVRGRIVENLCRGVTFDDAR
jgi:(2Fe-2S) ferredoxin